MKPEDIELIRRVFPIAEIELEDNEVVVHSLLRFSEKPFVAKTIGGSHTIHGYEVVGNTDEDVFEIAHNPNLGAVAIEGAKWLAGFLARWAVDQYNTELFATAYHAEKPNG